MIYSLCNLRKLIVELRQFEQMFKKEWNLSLNEAVVLCQTSQGMNEPTKLASQMEISPSRLSRILQTLQQRGLLNRSVIPLDRRGVIIELTSDGIAVVEQLHCSSIALPSHIDQILTHMNTGAKAGL
ncbi:MAG: MarR family transcriptional regulator [Sphaerochaetaceae bacterium]